MPEVQSEIQFTFEILPASLSAYSQIDPTQHADLIDACGATFFGSEQSDVQALLAGPIGRPQVPVSARGVPTFDDCWSRVLAFIAAYNAIPTGLTLQPPTPPPHPPEPHCAHLRWVDGVLILVFNWEVTLVLGGRTEAVFSASGAAGIQPQVLALGHVALAIPVLPVAP